MNIPYYKVYKDMKRRHDLAERLLNSHVDYFDDTTRRIFESVRDRYKKDMVDLRNRYEREKER